MKLLLILALVMFVVPAPQALHAQAADIPSAAPPQTGNATDTDRGRTLLREMVTALGGEAWLHRTSMQMDGRGSAFFHGQPDPYIIEYHELDRFAASGQPAAERVGFLTDRSMILPGKKIDVVQIWKDGHGYEITYKGKTDLPKEQVEDYYRRRAHSVDEVVHSWIDAPGVMIVAEGTDMVGRRLADKVTVLSANNDAVTLDLDATTHLPVRRTFQWRNPQFKDYDEEVEEYDDYHVVQGVETAMTITRYHNGDMSAQRYLTKVAYNVPADASIFDPAVALKKK
jgi:hypothetical protein